MYIVHICYWRKELSVIVKNKCVAVNTSTHFLITFITRSTKEERKVEKSRKIILGLWHQEYVACKAVIFPLKYWRFLKVLGTQRRDCKHQKTCPRKLIFTFLQQRLKSFFFSSTALLSSNYVHTWKTICSFLIKTLRILSIAPGRG